MFSKGLDGLCSPKDWTGRYYKPGRCKESKMVDSMTCLSDRLSSSAFVRKKSRSNQFTNQQGSKVYDTVRCIKSVATIGDYFTTGKLSAHKSARRGLQSSLYVNVSVLDQLGSTEQQSTDQVERLAHMLV